MQKNSNKFKGWITKKKLSVFDSVTGTSKKAKMLAKKKGLKTSRVLDSFGRDLKYYSNVVLALRKFGGKLKGKRLLHVASSSGILARYLQSKGMHAVALDSSKNASIIAKKVGNKKVITADAMKQPFIQNSFDFIISDHFLFSNYMSWERERSVLEGLKNLIKPNGLLLINNFFSADYRARISAISGFKIIKEDVQNKILVLARQDFDSHDIAPKRM